MKKALSILFVFLIILSVMHVTIASHYCGSAEATFNKVSVTGELASCGMEGPDDECSTPGSHFGQHCCDDKISILAVDNNYTPSYTGFTSFAKNILQIYFIPVTIEAHSLVAINHISTNASPPVNLLVSNVSLPKICVFLN